MYETVTLTPAQYEFLVQALPGYNTQDVELAGRAASQRYFVRIHHSGTSYILIVWDSRDEDWDRFLSVGRNRQVTSKLLPAIIADDPHHGLILEEDLGGKTLKRHCCSIVDDSQSVTEVYRQVLDALCLWHSPVLAEHPVIAARRMDGETFLWESAYFARYCVKDFCGCEALLNTTWEKDRQNLSQKCAALPATAIHRDFQSENVMLFDNRIRFVDFQGARLGPPEYDVASLLFDPYSNWIDEPERDLLYDYYCQKCNLDPSNRRSLYLCAAQRLMQALGAYGNLSLHKGKEWYRDFIPVALARLDCVVRELGDFPGVSGVVERCREVVGER